MIFLDTNFIIACFIKRDKYYNDVQRVWESIKNEEKVISKTIVIEVLNILNVQLKENIELSNKVYAAMFDFMIIEDHLYHDEALKLMNKFYSDNRLPFADCLYMALMESYGIEKIATFDKHFDLNKNINRIY